MTGPVSLLRGTRVVALEHAVAAPLCTRHLVELGAEVVKVERVEGGDFARSYDTALGGQSAHFAWLNRGKRSTAIDLKSDPGRRFFWSLLESADAFVCNLAAPARERLVADADLVDAFPRLVRCYITGYGEEGPYASRKAFDALIQGESGLMASTGEPDTPTRSGISVADVGAGTYAFGLTATCMLEARTSGVGRRIDVSLFDVLAEWLSPLLVSARNGSLPPAPAGSRHPTIVPYGAFAARDGSVVNLAVQNDQQWTRFCTTVLDEPELAREPSWSTNADRVQGRDELEPRIEARLRRLDPIDLRRRLDAADVPWGEVRPILDAAAHPHLQARRWWRSSRLPDGRHAEALAPPFLIDGTSPETGDVPGLGVDTHELLASLEPTTPGT